MKLSDIKDQLKQCEKIGVWEFCKTTPHLSLLVPAVDYDIVPLELGRNGEMSRTVQCLLVESLEQYAESRGYWFEFSKFPKDKENPHSVSLFWILRSENLLDGEDCINKEAPTRLQAALDAFLSLDWNESKKPNEAQPKKRKRVAFEFDERSYKKLSELAGPEGHEVLMVNPETGVERLVTIPHTHPLIKALHIHFPEREK